ncbi:hypothetical protein [Robertmurraya sp. Marseille-Q9965]
MKYTFKWELKNTYMDPIDFTTEKIEVDWVLEKVLLDTLQSECYFLQESSNLSETKSNLFRSNYMTRREMFKEMHFEELFQWLEGWYHTLESDTKIK